MENRRPVLMYVQTSKQSIVCDTYTFVMILATIGIGVLLESTAMQWVGFLMLFVILMVRASKLRKESTYTIEQAKKKLAELETSNGA